MSYLLKYISTLLYSNSYSAKLGKTFPGGWVGGEKLGIRLISASWGWGLAELGKNVPRSGKSPWWEVGHAKNKKKSTIQNVDYFEKRGGGPLDSGLPNMGGRTLPHEGAPHPQSKPGTPSKNI